jgi:hypothetical protein
MFKAKNLKDFNELQKVVEELNKEKIWKIRLEVKQDYSECDLYVIDNTEELYYDGCLFEYAMEKLNNALKIDTDDSGAFFDCECPGRWIADFEGRSRYDERSMELDIHIALGKALLRYMDDNGLEPHWTDELKKKFDELPKVAVSLIKEILK